MTHYARLGLDCRCTLEQIRAAYRILVKQHHPDLNQHSETSLKRTQDLNIAHETLSNPDLRAAYDRDLEAASKTSGRNPSSARRSTKSPAISQEVSLSIQDFLRGTTRVITINDPANPDGPEHYELVIPSETAPGTRIRIQRSGRFAGSSILLKLKVTSGFRFKVRGSDLRCDLRIKSDKAEKGGVEMIPGVDGSMLRVTVPRGVARNEVIHIPGAGLPKSRGGRGDLLVRITYQIQVRVTRKGNG